MGAYHGISSEIDNVLTSELVIFPNVIQQMQLLLVLQFLSKKNYQIPPSHSTFDVKMREIKKKTQPTTTTTLSLQFTNISQTITE